MLLPNRAFGVVGLILVFCSYARAASLLATGPTGEMLADSVRAGKTGESQSIMKRFASEQRLVGEGDTFVHSEGRFGAHLALVLPQESGKAQVVKDFLALPDGSIKEMAYRLPHVPNHGETYLNGMKLRNGSPSTQVVRFFKTSSGAESHTNNIYNVELLGRQKLRVLEFHSDKEGQFSIDPVIREGSEQFIHVRYKYGIKVNFAMSETGVRGQVVDAKFAAWNLETTVYDPETGTFSKMSVPFDAAGFDYARLTKVQLSSAEVAQLNIFAESKIIPGRTLVPTSEAAPQGLKLKSADETAGTAQ